MPLEGLGVRGAFVTEVVAGCVDERAPLDQDPLVVVGDLVSEVAEHRPVRLAELNPEPLEIVVARFREVDGDHSARVAGRDGAGAGVRRQQVERQPSRSFVVRVDREPELRELDEQTTLRPARVGQLLDRDRVIGRRPAPRQATGEALRRLGVGWKEPVALPASVGARDPRPTAEGDPVRRELDHRQLDRVEPDVRSAGHA